MENQTNPQPSGLPVECRCPSCPHFNECMAMTQKIFATATATPKNGQTPENLLLLQKEIEKTVKGDPVMLVCSVGGLILGATFGEWLKQNFIPRKTRKR